MKKLLLTGFEPFLSFTLNPTEQIVKELNGEKIGGFVIAGEILPVDFDEAGVQLLDLIAENKPDAVISLGLAGGRYKITPERIAINVSDGEKDNKGNICTDEPIQADGMDAYMTTLPVRKIVDRLKEEGLPAEISNTAGTYLCNHVMYTALHYARENELTMPAGFIHIPASHQLAIEHGQIPSWSHKDLKRSISICIETLSVSLSGL